MNKQTGILPKGYTIDGKYRILLFIKQGRNAETYRVKGFDGHLYFLKLFNSARINRYAFDSDNKLLEIEFLKSIQHQNIVSYKDSGEIIYEEKRYGFLVLNFISGETLAEKIRRESFLNFYDIKLIALDVLKGLGYLHSLSNPVIHNEITPENVMLDLTAEIPKAIIIDFGHARSFHQPTRVYDKEGLNLNYIAPECFNNLFSVQSDLYSVGALIYQLIFGIAPWQKDVSEFLAIRGHAEELMLNERTKPLFFPEIPEEFVGYEDTVELMLKKALNNDPEYRFQKADDFISALKGELIIEDTNKIKKVSPEENHEQRLVGSVPEGKGFSAIAGMKELKDQMQVDVIDALHNPEEYARYGITIPNGMLLYGPPGCGKTFFAKHFAEEVGYNFIQVNPGTLKSKYVNATEENIAKLFQEAEKNAPTIIFIEEISGLFPSRDSNAHEMSKNAVDAILAEMDRTGEKGIFVLCATNYPDKIDAALLRAGRLDKRFYIPPPDSEARKALFQMYLKNRPLDLGIDFDRLAELTENYVSSDIKDLIVDGASRIALKMKTRITMDILENVIQNTKPSVPLHEIRKYEIIRAKMDGESQDSKNERPKIGF